MKKILKAILVASLATVMVFSAAACGNNGGTSGGNNGGTAAGTNVDATLGTGANEIVGTWKMQFDETKVPEDMKAYVELYKSMLGSMEMLLQFNGDGTVNVSVTMPDMSSLLGSAASSESSGPQKGVGKWKREGDKVIISELTGEVNLDPTGMGEASAASAESGSGEFVLKDGKLIVENQEMMPFVKQ